MKRGVSLVVSGLCALPAAAQNPTTVYAMNDFRDDAVDQTLLLHAWGRMGMLDAATGQPATRQANGNYQLGANVVGAEIVRGGRVIGWRNAAGTIETYNLSGGANFGADCWARVANNGTLDIMKHGMGVAAGSLWRAKGVLQHGGALHLDAAAIGAAGDLYNGFTRADAPDAGTGRLSDATAYPLAARAGANISVVMSVCYGDAHPVYDDEFSLAFSVADTVRAIPGAASVVATGQAAIARMQYTIEPAHDDAIINAFAAFEQVYNELVRRKELPKKNVPAGKAEALQFRHEAIGGWLERQRGLLRWEMLRAELARHGYSENAGATANRVRAVVRPTEIVIPRGEPAPTPSLMSVVIDEDGGTYDYGEGLLPGRWPRITAQPGVFTSEIEVQASYVESRDPIVPDESMWPASAPVLISARRVDGSGQAVTNLTLEIPFDYFFVEPMLYRWTGSAWAAQSTQSVDLHYGSFTLSPGSPAGIYQAFSFHEAYCAGDFDRDGFITGFDFDDFVISFEMGLGAADFDRDGFVTGLDFDAFVRAFEAGC